ncbi:DUF4148 domain-containing protein [Paraburkholderia sp. DHOC27]|uniref:DUF4148 domain-containing protein n=1 Tax=Paraburkholderia sp. DHOC27 TaxID=2303330 RepID=UPI000E3E8240|nr:DUF4148 domain-containing protein [Paraburkholderia sp. DHOC27]RFU45117.1 DUF4148 domain-containing protein [Paraburkholderia sp. DHOC27]
MKAIHIAALFGMLATGTAFAQSNPATPTNAATNVAMTSAAPQTGAGTWVPPYGQAIAPKTRAQVYGELVQAEKDGQLAYLDSTIYAHS